MIEDRLKEVCRNIFSDRIDRDMNNPIVLVPIMNGGRPVAEHFKKALEEMAPSITTEEFPITIKRTDKETLTEPRIKEFLCDKDAFKDRFVIIIDDLTDNAETLRLAREKISGFGPKELITFVAVVKRKPPANGFLPDYYCFFLGYDPTEADKKWLFGYGMDIRDRFRDCNFIAEYKLS